MDSIAIVILPFVLFSLARALLYRASGGWRATLGAALAAVAAWFALFWALIGLALGVASCDMLVPEILTIPIPEILATPL